MNKKIWNIFTLRPSHSFTISHFFAFATQHKIDGTVWDEKFEHVISINTQLFLHCWTCATLLHIYFSISLTLKGIFFFNISRQQINAAFVLSLNMEWWIIFATWITIALMHFFLSYAFLREDCELDYKNICTQHCAIYWLNK